MRSILHTLPIRWQITVLHTTILAVVLAVGSLLVWQTQRRFQLDGLMTKHATEARALIPDEANPKVNEFLFSTPPVDRARLKELYPDIIAAIFPPDQDPAVSYKMLASLNPKLIAKLAPPDKGIPDAKQLAVMLAQLSPDDLFPPSENAADISKRLGELSPELATQLFGAPQLDQTALRKWAEGIVYELGTKERSVVLFALDGTVLAQSTFGPSCSPDLSLAKTTFGAKISDPVLDKLKMTQYLDQVDQGQLTLLLPALWQQGQPLALAQICVPTDTLDATLNQLAISLAAGWALVVGLATVLGVTATRRVLRPLDQIVATTRRIAAGDLRQRVGLPAGRTEIAQLGAAFDAMVARLETAFATQRRFVADAAHELRTPLTALSTSVELLLMGAADNDRATAQRLLRHLDSELSRVIRLTNDLLTLSRLDARPQIALRPTDLSALLEEVGEHSRALLGGQELIVDVAPELWVLGDADRLRQVMLNLLDNARKYTPPSGQIILRASSECSVLSSEFMAADNTTTRPDIVAQSEGISTQNSKPWPEPSRRLKTQNLIVIEVEDTGVGIPTDALSHLFERFYRVDSARARASGGSGLGLAIVQAIVRAHHGQVEIRSTPGIGTCVTVQLRRLPTPSIRAIDAQDQVTSTSLPG